MSKAIRACKSKIKSYCDEGSSVDLTIHPKTPSVNILHFEQEYRTTWGKMYDNGKLFELHDELSFAILVCRFSMVLRIQSTFVTHNKHITTSYTDNIRFCCGR